MENSTLWFILPSVRLCHCETRVNFVVSHATTTHFTVTIIVLITSVPTVRTRSSNKGTDREDCVCVHCRHPAQTMAEREGFNRHRRHDSRDYDRSDRRGHDDRSSRGASFYDPRSIRHDEDRRRDGGRGGRGRFNDHRRGPPATLRRVDDRFHLFHISASNQDWKGDSIEYSQEGRGTDGPSRQRPSQRDEEAVQHWLRLLWSASPEPPVQGNNSKEGNRKKRKNQSDSDESSSSSESDEDSSSSSSDSSSEESRRRRRRRHRRNRSGSRPKRRRRDDSERKKKSRRYFSSSSSSSESDSSSSSDPQERAPERPREPTADVDENLDMSREQDNEHDDDALPVVPAPREDDSDDDSVGPQPAPVDDSGATAAGVTGMGGGKAHYGKALLPGEGSAMAQYVQNNMRVPRRGEIGYEADQIDRFEKSGYVMSGSRHARMNAVRIRKENQVYTAEEQRALALITLEEKAEKEKALVQDFRAILEQKLHGKDEGKEG